MLYNWTLQSLTSRPLLTVWSLLVGMEQQETDNREWQQCRGNSAEGMLGFSTQAQGRPPHPIYTSVVRMPSSSTLNGKTLSLGGCGWDLWRRRPAVSSSASSAPPVRVGKELNWPSPCSISRNPAPALGTGVQGCHDGATEQDLARRLFLGSPLVGRPRASEAGCLLP